MITITQAKMKDATVLALLGQLTYAQSHGHFIPDKTDLSKYIDNAFSVAKIREDLNTNHNLFYLLYVDDLPIGYAKLVLNAKHESISQTNNCRLERIYILNEFIRLKLGQQFLNFLFEKARTLGLETMWLSVYIKNFRAIRFYERNVFKAVGKLNFLVNGIGYENIVYSKHI